MVLIIEHKNTRELKRRVRKWKKLGVNYYELVENLKSISILEKQLAGAVRICNEQTEAVKKKKEEVRKTYQYLASQERVK
jgi:hypothetical protein